MSFLAPGLAADNVSAIATITLITLVASVSPWWDAIAFWTTSFSLYFLAISKPISTWEPSTSKSIALPISCNNPALLASVTFSPNSPAIIPDK